MVCLPLITLTNTRTPFFRPVALAAWHSIPLFPVFPQYKSLGSSIVSINLGDNFEMDLERDSGKWPPLLSSFAV